MKSSVARLQGPSRRKTGVRAFGPEDAARLLVGVLVRRIEGAGTRSAAVTKDIARLQSLTHGAQLALDHDILLPPDFVGATGALLAALADPARTPAARRHVEAVGIAGGAGRMAGWIEVREGEGREDFDYAATSDDLAALAAAPVLRSIEARVDALLSAAAVFTEPDRKRRRSKR